jgi:hypothetical protein
MIKAVNRGKLNTRDPAARPALPGKRKKAVFLTANDKKTILLK